MPDPSDDPASSPPPAPDSVRPATAGSPAHLAPAPRVHPPGARQARDPRERASTPPPPPGFRAALEWIGRYGNLDAIPTGLADAAAPDQGSARLQLPKDQRKFHKFDPEHPQLPSEAGGSEASSVEGFFPPETSRDGLLTVEHPHGITPEQLARMRRLREEGPDRGPWVAVVVAVLAFLAVAVAFTVLHFAPARLLSASRPPTVPPAESVAGGKVSAALPPDVLGIIDQASHAEGEGDDAQAIDLLERVQRDHGHIDGLNYHLATLWARANDPVRALRLLEVSITDGEEVAACLSLRGSLANATDAPGRGLDDLEKATQLEPFDARYFFAWGEALRRAGKPELALEQLRRALDRLQDPASRAMYALKVRLTQIALDQEARFLPEMNAKLKLDPPPADWLLTAAAVDLRHGDIPAAAAAFFEIQAVLGPQATAVRLQDPFFRPYARESALARFFEPPAASPPEAATTP